MRPLFILSILLLTAVIVNCQKAMCKRHHIKIKKKSPPDESDLDYQHSDSRIRGDVHWNILDRFIAKYKMKAVQKCLNDTRQRVDKLEEIRDSHNCPGTNFRSKAVHKSKMFKTEEVAEKRGAGTDILVGVAINLATEALTRWVIPVVERTVDELIEYFKERFNSDCAKDAVQNLFKGKGTTSDNEKLVLFLNSIIGVSKESICQIEKIIDDDGVDGFTKFIENTAYHTVTAHMIMNHLRIMTSALYMEGASFKCQWKYNVNTLSHHIYENFYSYASCVLYAEDFFNLKDK